MNYPSNKKTANNYDGDSFYNETSFNNNQDFELPNNYDSNNSYNTYNSYNSDNDPLHYNYSNGSLYETGNVKKSSRDIRNNKRKGTPKDIILIFWGWMILSIVSFFVFINKGELWTMVPELLQMTLGLEIFLVSVPMNRRKFFLGFLAADAVMCTVLTILRLSFPVQVLALGNNTEPDIMLFIMFFMATGTVIIAGPIGGQNRKKKRCTESVLAECVDIRTKRGRTSKGGSITLFSAVYRYNYNGRSYENAENMYSKTRTPMVGEQRMIFLDPDHPSFFYEPKRDRKINFSIMIIGIMIVAISVAIIINEYYVVLQALQ